MTVDAADSETDSAATAHAGMEWSSRWPTGLVVAAIGALLVWRADRYDYFGDELYFVAAGRHLAASYVDQGPLVPMIARATELVAPHSLVALRFPSIVAALVTIVLTSALAREFGGDRRARLWAAIAYASCPFLITQTATLSTFAFDVPLCTAFLLALMRWARTRHDGWLWAAVVVVAVEFQVKPLVAVLVSGVAVGLIVAGPRAIWRRPPIWLGGPALVASCAPAAWWQYRHGWPQLAMGAVIRDEQRAAMGGVIGLPVQLVLALGLLGTIAAVFGIPMLLRTRQFRFIAVGIAVVLAFVVVTGGRPYYLAGLFPVLFGAGAVMVARWVGWPARGRFLAAAVSALIAVGAVLALPRSADHLDQPTETSAELSTRLRTFGPSGWSNLINTTRAAAAQLNSTDHAVIITRTYWQASGLTILGSGLPRVYSPHRGYADFGVPGPEITTVLSVGTGGEPPLNRELTTCVPLANHEGRLGFPGIDRDLTVWRCDQPRRPWPEIWAALTSLPMEME